MEVVTALSSILVFVLWWCWLRYDIGSLIKQRLEALGRATDVRSVQFALYQECAMRYGDTWRKNYRLVLTEARRRGLTIDDDARLEVTRELEKVFEEGRWIDPETINAEWRNSL